MNVRFMSIGTTFIGVTVVEGTEVDPPWRVEYPDGIKPYAIRSQSGNGVVFAGSVAHAETGDDPDAPSSFFMM